MKYVVEEMNCNTGLVKTRCSFTVDGRVEYRGWWIFRKPFMRYPAKEIADARKAALAVAEEGEARIVEVAYHRLVVWTTEAGWIGWPAYEDYVVKL